MLGLAVAYFALLTGLASLVVMLSLALADIKDNGASFLRVLLAAVLFAAIAGLLYIGAIIPGGV